MRFLNKLVFAWLRVLPLWLAALWFMPGHAWAAASCSSNYSSFLLTLPTAVAVPRDLPNGSMLSAWVSSPASSNAFTCVVSASTSTGVGFATSGIMGGTPTGFTGNYNGSNFYVYPTPLPGIGLAMGVRGYFNGCGWSGYGSLNGWGGLCNANGTINNGGQVVIALVKTGAMTPGTISGTVAYMNGGGGAPNILYNITPVAITVLTCDTPSKTVPMGTHPFSELPAVGSLSANPASFTLDVNNCPAGARDTGLSTGQINTVQYQLSPSNGMVSGFTNVAALSGSPSAGGIGIQLFDSSGKVVPLGTNISLPSFKAGTAANYSVPMTARYYRTGALSAGPANATMTIIMTYQ